MNGSESSNPPAPVDVSASPLSVAKLRKALEGWVEMEKPADPEIDTAVTPSVLDRDVPGSENEPIYDAVAQGEIQGNIIPGFNKDHQHFLFFRVGGRKPYPKAKDFLGWLTPFLSSMEEVVTFRRLWRARRRRVGTENVMLCATWVNVAFSYSGVAKLVGTRDADAFGDESFRQGLAARSTYLGDPTDTKALGHPSNWVVGGNRNAADLVIIVSSDIEQTLDDLVAKITSQAASADLELLFEQRGNTLPGKLRGHEHFGFRDGISQPGIRGKLSAAPGDYITPRYIRHNDPRSAYFAKPGQLLVWPGQFLLGERRQSTENLTGSVPPASMKYPQWANRGSYLVVRRLHQDVRAFWSFVTNTAAHLGIDSTKIASLLVGRWPSGAPVVRTSAADDPALGADEFANNHFLFDDDTRPSQLKPITGYPGDSFPNARADFTASVCPHFAHIRKMNPRESVTELGKPEDNLARMILRRGIPYGPPIIGRERLSRRLVEQDRGLMFLCYGSTIEEQYEFLSRRWANSPAQPNFGGPDLVIGQNANDSNRRRSIDLPLPAGGTQRIDTTDEWVIPTGGGYFFAPSIVAVRRVFAS